MLQIKQVEDISPSKTQEKNLQTTQSNGHIFSTPCIIGHARRISTSSEDSLKTLNNRTTDTEFDAKTLSESSEKIQSQSKQPKDCWQKATYRQENFSGEEKLSSTNKSFIIGSKSYQTESHQSNEPLEKEKEKEKEKMTDFPPFDLNATMIQHNLTQASGKANISKNFQNNRKARIKGGLLTESNQNQIAAGKMGSIHTIDGNSKLIQKRPLKNEKEYIQDLKKEAKMSQFLGIDNEGKEVDYVVVSQFIQDGDQVYTLMEEAQGDLQLTISSEVYLDNEDKIKNLDKELNKLKNKLDTLSDMNPETEIFSVQKEIVNQQIEGIKDLVKNNPIEKNAIYINTNNDMELIQKNINLSVEKKSSNLMNKAQSYLNNSIKVLQEKSVKPLEKMHKGNIGHSSLENKHKDILRLTDCYSHIWGKGVYHLDMKPGNMLVVDGKIKVSDFGGASEKSDLNKNTVTQAFTPPYRSAAGSEKIENPPSSKLEAQFPIEKRTEEDKKFLNTLDKKYYQETIDKEEVFALGVMIFERYSGGRFPYSEETQRGGSKYLDGQFQKELLEKNGVNPAMINTIEKMVSLDPKNRPSTSEIKNLIYNAMKGVEIPFIALPPDLNQLNEFKQSTEKFAKNLFTLNNNTQSKEGLKIPSRKEIDFIAKSFIQLSEEIGACKEEKEILNALENFYFDKNIGTNDSKDTLDKAFSKFAENYGKIAKSYNKAFPKSKSIPLNLIREFSNTSLILQKVLENLDFSSDEFTRVNTLLTKIQYMNDVMNSNLPPPDFG